MKKLDRVTRFKIKKFVANFAVYATFGILVAISSHLACKHLNLFGLHNEEKVPDGHDIVVENLHCEHSDNIYFKNIKINGVYFKVLVCDKCEPTTLVIK